MTHCCHSPQAPCRARQTSKAAPCHLTCSLSANQPILPQIKPVKSLLAWALSSWCPSAREGQQSRRRRRLALSLVASQGRDNAGCKWPPDRLPLCFPGPGKGCRRPAEGLLSGASLANEVPVASGSSANSKVLGVHLSGGTAINKICVSAPSRDSPTLSKEMGTGWSGFQITGRPLSGLIGGLMVWSHTGNQS